MGIFDFGKKKDKLDKDVKKAFFTLFDGLAAQKITDQAISYRNLKQYDKAISLLMKAINEYHYLPANSILGNTLAMKGDIDAAEAHFKKMLSDCIKRDDYFLVEIYGNLGSLYHKYRKDDKTALKYYQLALDAPMPKAAGGSEMGFDLMVSNVYCDLGIIYFDLKEFPLAKQYAFKRLQTVKDCPFAARVYGDCLLHEGDVALGIGKYQEAIACYDNVIEINPEYTDYWYYWYNKGVALHGLGKCQEAIACYDKAVEINPRHADAWYNKGAALNKLSKHQEEITCYDRALGINSRHVEAWDNKGRALHRLGMYQEAIACYDKAVEINPRDDTWYSKGVALGGLGKHQEEIACYDKALEINARNTDAWINKGVALGKLSTQQEAVACFDRAIEINPRYAAAWFNKGIVLVMLGKFQEAVACFGKALEINPSHEDAWYYKGLAEDKLHKTSKLDFL